MHSHRWHRSGSAPGHIQYISNSKETTIIRGREVEGGRSREGGRGREVESGRYFMVSVFGWPDPNTRECCHEKRAKSLSFSGE